MSGAGKTTLTKLLLRLSDIQEGRILVDGQDVACTTQQSLRRQIAYVPQESLLFHRSVAENIAYGKPDATMDEIREAESSLNAFIFNPLHIYNTIDIILQLYCRHLYQISKAHVYNQKNESFSS